VLASEHVVGRMRGDPWATDEHGIYLRRADRPDTGRWVFLPESVPPVDRWAAAAAPPGARVE